MNIDTIQDIRVKHHVLFMAVTFLFWSSQYVYSPILSSYLEQKGAGHLLIGFILGSYGITQLFIRFPLGVMSDHLSRRKLFVLLGLVMSMISCIGLLMGEFGWILTARLISGVSASTWVVFTVLYSSYFVSGNMTKAMSNIQFVTVASQLLGMSASAFLVSYWGWTAPFWVALGFAIIGVILSFGIKDMDPRVIRKPVNFVGLRTVMKEPTLLKVSMLSTISHSTLFITIYGFTPLQAFKISGTEQSISLLVVAFMVPHAIGTFLSGRLFVERLGIWTTLTISFMGSAVFTFVTPFINDLGLLCLTQGINGFAQGLSFPLLLSLALVGISYEKRGTAMGFYQAFYSLGIFLGPLLAGYFNNISGLNGGGGFLFSAATGILAVCLTIYWKQSEISSNDSVVEKESI
ncbi:MFS transporter [Paenibacillus alginolyticus]|uniref:MFS transporter n=1 Tax=Paenibacillus alginolyticus TaxID=59839 RepID=UPI0003F8CD69|nr:MFS transporter [Paenibacillus alginolyticus]MCY9665793.1 MFS transporter [Paenibacillus alginolyticus]